MTYRADTISMDNHCQIQQREITPKVRKAELLFLYATRRLVLFYISTKYHKNTKGSLTYRADTKSFSNKTKGDNSKSKKAGVVNLVCDTSSRPDLHFYQVSSKYSKGHLSYRADKKFFADANGIRPKNNMSPPPWWWWEGGGGGGGGHNSTSQIWKFSDEILWYFSYFCSKHRLWVLVRTASKRFKRLPQSMFWAEIWKIIYTPVNPSFTI